jgi:predicted RNA binding protein YcfA (HicA-like mRNA interferase family)
MSGREVMGILAASGFVQVRQKGSHVLMQRRL